MTKARDIASAAPAPSTVSATELGYLDGVSSAIQTQLDGKQAANANVSTTELGYLDGVTSAIQTQLDGKVASSLVDAKGDLLVGSADNTLARLATGNAGETLVADSSTSTGLRYNPQNALANPVINGGFDIWQRGTSIARSGVGGTAADYTADRWVFGGSGGSAVTVSRQATSDTTNLPNIQYCGRFQRNSGNTDTSTLYYGYVFENVNSTPFIGKTVTVSFYARKGANFSSAGDSLGVSCGTGTGTDQAFFAFTGASTPIGQANTLTTTWQRFTATGTLSSSGTQMRLWFSYTPSGTAGANDYFEVTGVQIDLGTYTASSAPTFRRSGGTLAGELAACKRYYAKYSFTSGRNITVFAAYASGSAYGKLFDFQTEMRTAPSVTMTGIANLKPMNSSGSGSTTTVFSGGSTDFNATANTLFANGFTGSSGLTAGNTTVIASSGGTVDWEVSAEL